MSGFSNLGVGSGLDLDGLVRGLVSAERAPQEARLNRSRGTAQTTLSALGRLRSSVTGLTDAARALQDLTVGVRVKSADTTIIEARKEGEPDIGSFQLRVSALASAQSLASQAFEAEDAELGPGELVLSMGEDSVTLSLAEGASTLRDVRDAINASELDVQAAVVRDGENWRLLLTSGQTGTAGELTLTAGAGVDGRLASTAMDVTAPAQDAQFSVNGLALSSSSNRIEEVLPGLSLTLRGVTEGDASVTVSVEPDRDAVRTRLQTLVSRYNALVDNIRTAGRADPEGENSGPLVGDSTLRAIQSRLSGVFSTRLDTGEDAGLGESGFSTLLDLGLSTNLEGRAALDADKLTAALETDQAGVEALVSAFAERFTGVLEGFGGRGGILETRTESLNAQLRRITQQREALDRRMEQVESRLRAQFSALDSVLTQFQNTSSFLAQQLQGLANLRPQR
ncbi:MAG: flagellar filament capping protein FliD [Gammaproteobacteria bacterium]|nr:flagellar filament capping protein FliD [Gammaproteobacteria bacterium]